MLNDFLSGTPIVDIARKRAVSVRAVLDAVNSVEARETIDAIREASRAQCSIYLEQHRAQVLRRLRAVAVRTRELGIDIASPSGAFVMETIRKACADLLRAANGQPHRLRSTAESPASQGSTVRSRAPRPMRAPALHPIGRGISDRPPIIPRPHDAPICEMQQRGGIEYVGRQFEKPAPCVEPRPQPPLHATHEEHPDRESIEPPPSLGTRASRYRYGAALIPSLQVRDSSGRGRSVDPIAIVDLVETDHPP